MKIKMSESHVLEINPKNEKTWNNIGSAYFKLNMYHEAVKSFEKALYIDPSYDMASRNRKKALVKIKNNNFKDSCGQHARKRT